MKIIALFFLIFIYSCSENTSIKESNTNAFYENAWNYLDRDEQIKAFIEFGKAKDYFSKQKDSLGVAKCLMNMAIIQEKMGDYFGSQETAIYAISYFNNKKDNHQEYLISNFNTLGITSRKLKNYHQAIDFYNKALEISTDINTINVCKNNLANSYKKNKNYQQAIIILESLISNSSKRIKSLRE